MKGRFEASWRIVLALAVVLSLGLMTVVPVMALSLTSVAPLPCTVKAAANYTVTFQPAIAVNTSAYIYVYFPDASATNDPVLTGVTAGMTTIDAVGVATVTSEKYNVMDAVDNVLKIKPNATVTANASHVLVFGEVTNLCPKGSHTLQIWTDAEKTAVSTTYTLCTDGNVTAIVLSPAASTVTACQNVTFTATGYDKCGTSLGAVNLSLMVWGDNGTLSWSGNNVTTCLPIGTWNITGTYNTSVQNWTTLKVTAGPAKNLTLVSGPTASGTCCLNLSPVVNVTDCCNNPVNATVVTASIVSPTGGTFKTGSTTTATTNSSGLAEFKNLLICANGTYTIGFSATGTNAVNSSSVTVSTDVADHLVLAPCPSSVVVNNTKTFTAEAFDKCGNDLGNVTSSTNFTISAGAGANFTGASVTPVACGIWTVTGVLASNSSVSGTCTLTVTHAACPVSISISPAAASIESGNSQQFIATATDAFGCMWDATGDSGTTWSINLSAAGGMWASLYPGKYVSEHTGCFEVTVTECGANDTAYLTVTPSMCFIATATYGTPMAQEIQILRAFRDGYLLTNPLGRALVAFYYKTSPPIAQFITEHPSLKPIVRAMLVPALAMSTIVVNNGVTLPLIVLGLVLVAVALAIWATRRRGRGSAYA
jgi:hypothetical protein